MDLSKPNQSPSVCRIFELKNTNMEQATFIIMRDNYKNKELITRFKSLMSCWIEKSLLCHCKNVFDPKPRQTYRDIPH